MCLFIDKALVTLKCLLRNIKLKIQNLKKHLEISDFLFQIFYLYVQE